jgi:hypothetical protein
VNRSSTWPRLTLEALVIVVSILLAFCIDAWWGNRQERGRIDTALVNLQAGFIEHVGLIDAELERMEPFEKRVALFLDTDAGLADLDGEDGYGVILEALHRPVVNALNGDELLALLDAEALRDLDASRLWAATAAWRGAWRVVTDRHDSLYELEDEVLRALSSHAASRSVVTRSFALDEVGESALREARRDDVLVSLATVKAYHLEVLRLLYGDLQRRADSVLIPIRAELER